LGEGLKVVTKINLLVTALVSWSNITKKSTKIGKRHSTARQVFRRWGTNLTIATNRVLVKTSDVRVIGKGVQAALED
jgi:hypothetical protein